MAAMEGEVGGVFERCGQPVARLRDDRVLARLDPLHVDADLAGDRYAVFGRPPRRLRRIGARHQRLGRRAAGVDAGAADEIALDDRDLHAGAGQPQCQSRPGLTGANYDRVVVGHGRSNSGADAG